MWTTIIFIISFVFTLISYIIHNYYHYREYKTGKHKEGKFGKFIELGYVTWILMGIFDPLNLGVSYYIFVPLGLIISVLGIIILSKTLGKLEKLHEGRGIIKEGIYVKLRHPIYYGTILVVIGIPLIFQTTLTLISSAIWISFMLVWRYWEEKSLTKKFGKEYEEYKKETWF